MKTVNSRITEVHSITDYNLALNAKRGQILLVEQCQDARSRFEQFFTAEGYKYSVFPMLGAVLDYLEMRGATIPREDVDLIICGIDVSSPIEAEMINRIRKARPDLPVLVMRENKGGESVIKAEAEDFIAKPFSPSQCKAVIEKTLRAKSVDLLDRAGMDGQTLPGFDEIIGKSPSMVEVFDLIQRVSASDTNVLILGESGTGKELVARSIHKNSARRKGPFVAINCSAIPENLLESELFGHTKGAFTGASERRRGLFEEAEGGTLFLDEIGDLDFPLQAKLLRVLQERKIRAVGENVYRSINVRIIAATHKVLKDEVKKGKFREDLFYRLSVIPVVIPPLRQRREDIPLLARYFLHKFSTNHGKNIRSFSREALLKIVNQQWAGNVRELENVIERAVVLASSEVIHEREISVGDYTADEEIFERNGSVVLPLKQIERRYIEFVLRKTGWKKEKAAQLLGIDRKTLLRKQRGYGLSQDNDKPQENVAQNDPSFVH